MDATQIRTAGLSNLMDRIDRATHPREVATQPLTPPAYGDNHRNAIHSCIGALANEICERTQQLRKQLDAIDQTVLQSAEKSRNVLDDHVSLSGKIDAEIRHMTEVIAELAGHARET